MWNFNDELPKSALRLGADAVVHSLHKTGGAMTQASMLHLGKDSVFDEVRVSHALKLLHTTSPSLLLLASLDAARANLSSSSGQSMLQNAIDNAKYFRTCAKSIDKLQVLSNEDIALDLTKLFIKFENLSGKQLEYILEHDYSIEVESASDEGILLLSNLGNTKEEFDYLFSEKEKLLAPEYFNDIKNTRKPQ